MEEKGHGLVWPLINTASYGNAVNRTVHIVYQLVFFPAVNSLRELFTFVNMRNA